MTMFGAIHTSGTGLGVYRLWLDAISDNIANINTVRPMNEDAFQARYIEAQAKNPNVVGGGTAVKNVLLGNAEGKVMWDPTNPLADENGMVRYPDVDLGDQMTQLMLAQRGYEANLAVIDRVRDAYQAALGLGK